MVSRSYYEVVSRLSQEYTRLFNYAGARTDKHVREHEVYAVGPGQEEQPKAIEEPALVAPTISPPPPPPAQPPERTTTTAAATPASMPAPSRSKWLIPGAVAAVVVLAVAIFAGMQFRSNKAGSAEPAETAARAPAAMPAMSSPVAVVPAAASGPTVAAATPQAAAAAPAAKADPEPKAAAAKTKAADADPTKAPPTVVAQKAAPTEPAATKKNEARKDNVAKADAKGATGTLEFWISPYGDVLVDGKQVGTAPPLKTYKVPVGSHKVEVINDNAGFPYSVNVEVKADEVVRVNKSFPAAR
jgi:hypothetical protein